jgi:hypothetical protein
VCQAKSWRNYERMPQPIKIIIRPTTQRIPFLWATEYADYMVEAIAGQPWHEEEEDFLWVGIMSIQESMHQRRWTIYHQVQTQQQQQQDPCHHHHTVVSLSCFPALGAVAEDEAQDDMEDKKQYWQRILDTNGERHQVRMMMAQASSRRRRNKKKDQRYSHYLPVSRSLFLSDAVTSPHVRYQTLTRNMRLRKGAKMCSVVADRRNVRTTRDQPYCILLILHPAY